MVVQRRYSVTGQTPPDHVDVDVGPMKPQHSPKLQALDTSVQTTSCGLCEGAVAAADPSAKSSTAPSTTAAIRTSSKRSATQLPSPNTPSSHQLPTKIARLGLEHHDMDVDEGALTDPFPEEESDWALSSFASSSASIPSSPEYSPPTSLPDETIVESLDLCQDSSDHLALSPPPQPPAKLLYSIANTHLDQESEPNQRWDHDFSLLSDMPYQAAHHQHHEQHLAHSNSPVARSDSPLRENDTPQLTATLLTLPPELRHHIYLHLPDLVLPYPLIYCLSTFANNMQHPLASVSRLIRSEALAIFYSYNSWIIKLEFKMMYEAFQDWIIRLGDGAGLLRLVTVAVRGSLFKPKTSHASSVVVNGQLIHIPGGVPASNNQSDEQYHPPDGDASFRIDLSEKYPGGKVELVRNDGTVEAGEKAMGHLTMLVRGLWEKRRAGTLNGQDWVNMVDNFLGFTGWW